MHVKDLCVYFPVQNQRLLRGEEGIIRAVDGVSFSLRQGETLALVGPAGSGKTTAARAVALLQRPTAGRIFFQGADLTTGRGRRFKEARRQVQMLFSNPYTTFAPRMTVEKILREALTLKKHTSRKDHDQRIAELMMWVGLNLYLSVRFPRDLSGGCRQRLALARALATEPAILICDQPVEYVDPVAGETIIDLVAESSRRLGLTTLLTTRQLSFARHADRIAVMLRGRIVEMGYYADIVRTPLHPFTRALVQSSGRGSKEVVDPMLGSAPRPAGCHYAPACPLVDARCRESYPAFVQGAPQHGVACHRVEPAEK